MKMTEKQIAALSIQIAADEWLNKLSLSRSANERVKRYALSKDPADINAVCDATAQIDLCNILSKSVHGWAGRKIREVNENATD